MCNGITWIKLENFEYLQGKHSKLRRAKFLSIANMVTLLSFGAKREEKHRHIKGEIEKLNTLFFRIYQDQKKNLLLKSSTLQNQNIIESGLYQ